MVGDRRALTRVAAGGGWGTMGRMLALDADLVGRWFDRVRRPDPAVHARWGIRPSAQEREVLDEGGIALACAVRDLPAPAPVVPLTEPAAELLRGYLSGLAAGISEARRLLVSETSADLMGGLDPGSAVSGGLALAAGLNAGAAALDEAARGSSIRRSAAAGPTVAEAARSAGVAGAELVVDGANLRQVAARAAQTLATSWLTGLPADEPGASEGRADDRATALIGMVLAALEHECRDPLPPARPAGCGAGPGENRGAAFLAEITCTLHVEAAALPGLTGELGRLCREVSIWPTGGDPAVHLHTDRPGEVIEQLYASGMPFDLAITRIG